MNDDQRWLDKPGNVRKVVFGLYIVCSLLLLADFFYPKSPHFSFEGWVAFYPVFGFVVSFSLVLTAKQLRRVLKRDEDYFEQERQDDDG